MGILWQDIRYGFRMLRKNGGFTAIALITLAIGIGANTIMFSVIDGLLLRPLKVKEPDQLVGCEGGAAYLNYIDLRDNNPVFSDLTGYKGEEVSLKYRDYAERVMGFFVPANYFSTLGVAPVLGRDFLPREDQLGAEAVVVLTYDAWERYGADPDILGKEMLVNGWPCQVIGVMPRRFTGTSLVGPTIWLPWGVHYQILQETHRQKYAPDRIPTYAKYPWISLIGRLKSGLSMSEAQALLAPVTTRAGIKSRFPLYRLPRLFFTVGGDDRAEMIGFAVFLLGTSILILLIACLNLANMYVVEGTSRQRELAIRTALGSSRWRLVRQLLVESLLLAVLGGIGGLLLAIGGMRILNTSLTALRMPMGMSLSLRAGLDIRVFGGVLGFTTMAALLSGLWPALRLSQRCVTADLKEVRGGAFRSAGRSRRILPPGLSVVGQIALSVVLVMVASLFTHNAVKVAYATPGYSLDGKLLISLDLSGTGSGDMQRRQSCRRLLEHVLTLRGVQTAGMSDQIPFDNSKQRSRYIAPLGQNLDDDPQTLMHQGIGTGLQSIGGDYLHAVGLPLLRGRYFTSAESTTGAPVVIVNEALARRLRSDGDVLGCLISGSQEIVGIIPNVRQQILTKRTGPQLYQPLGSDFNFVYLTVRMTDSARALETALLRSIPADLRTIDPQISVVSAARLADYHRNGLHMWIVSMLARLSTALGIMALFLAGLGIYGVKSYMVASRTPEIGIRMALGATNRGVLTMVLFEGAIVTLVGLSIGMWAALSAAHLVRSALSDVGPVDPLSIAATVALLGSVSLLASYIPAWRAMKIDPIVALRYE